MSSQSQPSMTGGMSNRTTVQGTSARDRLSLVFSVDLARILYLTELVNTKIHSIRSSRCVHVYGEVHPSTAELKLTPHHLEELLLSIGSLPVLEQLEFFDFGDTEYPVPLEFLTELLNHPRTCPLKVLRLKDCHCAGNYESFTNTLRGLTGLEDFRMHRLTHHAMEIPHGFNPDFDAMIHVLNSLQHLKRIHLGSLYRQIRPTLELKGLQKLFQMPHLQEIRLHNFDFCDEHITVIANMVAEHNTHVKILELRLCDLEMSSEKALTRMLRKNRSLVEFQMEIPARLGWALDQFCLEMAQALEHNTTLKRLAFIGYDIHEHVEQAFVEMTKTNCVLESMYYCPTWKYHPAEMDLYLRLNKHGRYRLSHGYEGVSHEEWVQVLAKCDDDDIDCLYHFLQMNPLLICCNQLPNEGGSS